MVRLITSAVARLRSLVPELAKFGVVGATGAVIDLGGSALLYGTFHVGPLKAKAVALTAACVVTYLGSRFWTFRHRENQTLWRELALFIVLNGIGLLIAEAVIAFTAYAVGSKDQLAYNAASIVGTGLGTIFRFWAYRKWVFLAPLEEAVDPVAAVTLEADDPDAPVQRTPTLAAGRSFQPAPGTANGHANGHVNGSTPGANRGPSSSGMNGAASSTPNGSRATPAPGRHRKTR